MTANSFHADEMPALRRLSARAGSDPLLVQGPGGNASIKDEGVMWIKASGTWLAQAEGRDIFVPVDHGALMQGLKDNDPACESCVDFVRGDLNTGVLRPLIETTVHALMPQRVVVHVHCVNTIAWAVRADAETALAQPLAGFDWAFIPYARPGLPLARAIEVRLKPRTDLLILGNHGLVVAADQVVTAEALLDRVVKALTLPVRLNGAANLEALERRSAGMAFEPAANLFAHRTATDPTSLSLARRGTLYPDHVVFLGAGVAVLEGNESPDSAVRRAGKDGPLPKLVLVPGEGALLPREASATAMAMARCLADVTARLSPDHPIRVLSAGEEFALVNWDAEKYRQTFKAN